MSNKPECYGKVTNIQKMAENDCDSCKFLTDCCSVRPLDGLRNKILSEYPHKDFVLMGEVSAKYFIAWYGLTPINKDCDIESMVEYFEEWILGGE